MVRRGFTLIELLVVVAIIALLVGILLPSMAAATRVSKAVACMSQMRQIGIATMMYTEEFRGYLPRSTHSAYAYHQSPWGYALCRYFNYSRGDYKASGGGWTQIFNSLYRCPQDKRRDKNWSYGKNVWFELESSETGEVLGVANGPTFWRIEQVKRPVATIAYGELASGSMADHIMAHFWYSGGEPEVDAKRHGRTSNYTYLDAHVGAAVFEKTFDLKRKVDYWKPDAIR